MDPLAASTPPLLDVRDLRVEIGARAVVEDVCFSIAPGEAVGLVGESGSGKSQTALALMGLSPDGARVDGDLRFEGAPMDPAALRGRRMSMVFQDPMSSLNPTMRIGAQIAEPLRFHLRLDRRAARARARELLERVRIPDPAGCLDRYPHELSGGMRQRVMIAMAISCGPSLLVADEPTSALDVTVQAAILELLAELIQAEDLALLFIAHDLAVVRQVCSRVLVMFHGRLVESGPVEQVFRSPRHPYTQALLAAVPRLDGPADGSGPAPDTAAPVAWSAGCAYRGRCPLAQPDCAGSPPPWMDEIIRAHRCRHPL